MVPGLATIAAASFAGTTSLKSISIPSSVTTINAGNANVLGAFEGSGLESVDLSGTSITTTTNWPNPSAGSHGTFSNMPNLTSVTLPAGLTAIPSYAFYNSPKLKTVSFATASTPEGQRSTKATEGTLDFANASSLTTINQNAFQNTGITTLNFNGAAALTSIGSSAFTGSAVTSIDLNGATAFTTISPSAFTSMPELTTVKLPSTVTTIGGNAFANDAKLATLSQANPTSAGETVTHDDAEPTVGTAKFGSALTTINQQAFQGTGFSVVDLSGVSNPSNLFPTTGNNQNNAFTNLANLQKVELPATSSLDLANFGGNNNWSAQYGPDSSSTQATVNIGTKNNFNGRNYNRISNPTIEMQSSNPSGTTTLSWGLFNGNSTLTTLKLNRTADNLSDSNDLWAFQLGEAPSGTDVSAAYASAPLGNNSALTNLEFSGFSLQNTAQATESESGTNSFNKISSQTWSQVASIMNMFSKWTENGSSESARTGETVSAPTNLMAWPESGQEGSYSWIQADLDSSFKWDSVTPSNGQATTQAVVTTESETNNSIQANTSSATLKHNGVTWTYKNGGATSSTGRDGDNDNSITITGTVNIYRSKNGSTSYQTYFNTEDGKTEPTKTITVKLIIVPATSSTTRSTK